MDHDLELIIPILEILEIEVCNILQNPGNIGKRFFLIQSYPGNIGNLMFLDCFDFVPKIIQGSTTQPLEPPARPPPPARRLYFQDLGNNGGDFNFQYFQDIRK